MMRWIAFALAVVTLFIAIWIFLPGPTYFLLAFAVGAPEVSAWLIVGSAVAIVLGAIAHETAVGRASIGVAAIALALSLTPWLRLRSTIRRFDDAMQPLMRTPARPQRVARVSVADLFTGISTGVASGSSIVMFDAGAKSAPLRMQIYRPNDERLHPIVVQIYGGAWRGGEPTDFANFATWLTNAGYVVFAIDYRHAPAFRWRDQVADVDSALAWIRANAAQHGGDISRVVLLGRSAGAHLAMLSAYTEPPIPIRGIVSLYGPTDLLDSYRHPPAPDPLHIRGVEEAFIGGTPDEKPGDYAAASPITHVMRGMPPTLLIQGARDHIVEARYGRAMRDRLIAANVPVAYLEIPWAEHAFDEVFNGPSSQLALYYIERFLAFVTSDSGSLESRPPH
jgi:acetyl esterase/lipase